jgi:hypothetical protein
MPRRPDGRIEPGQKLASAISARAWNRAQDAADIVLGERTGFGAEAGMGLPGALVVPCLVTTTIEGVKPGHVVKLNQAGAKVIPSQSESETDAPCARVFSLTGNVVAPVTLDNYEDAKTGLGVVMYGEQMPSPGQPRIVGVCIAGMCVARVRPRFTNSVLGVVGPFQFMNAPVKRTVADTDALLTGAGEASSCGTHRIVQYIGDVGGPGSGNPLKFAVVLM